MIEGEGEKAALKEFVVTFGFGQRDRAGRPLDNCFARIPAATKEEARQKVVAARGMKWSFLYESVDEAGVIRHRLTEVPLQDAEGVVSEQDKRDAFIGRYRDAIVACSFAASMLAPLDVEKLLEEISNAHAFGAMLNPTLYREKQQALREDEELARAALPLWKMGRKLAALRAEKRAERTEAAEKE